MNTADQCRARGLEVGDTIRGRESVSNEWYETELTLVWMGKTEVMFLQRTRSTQRPEWTDQTESADWTLECREWVKV